MVFIAHPAFYGQVIRLKSVSGFNEHLGLTGIVNIAPGNTSASPQTSAYTIADCLKAGIIDGADINFFPTESITAIRRRSLSRSIICFTVYNRNKAFHLHYGVAAVQDISQSTASAEA